MLENGSNGWVTRSGARRPARIAHPGSSFADAEATEYLVEHLLGIDSANQISECITGGMEMNGGNRCGKPFVSPRAPETLELRNRERDRSLVPRLGEHRRVELRQADRAVEHFTDRRQQSLHTRARLGADRDGGGGAELAA